MDGFVWIVGFAVLAFVVAYKLYKSRQKSRSGSGSRPGFPDSTRPK